MRSTRGTPKIKINLGVKYEINMGEGWVRCNWPIIKGKPGTLKGKTFFVIMY